MCYSKEVQLLTSLLIFISCLVYYLYFRNKHKRDQWFQKFLDTILLVFVLIGLHQFSEFLSLLTGSEIIYKIGLVSSISAMYFVLQSFEILTNRNIHKNIALVVEGLPPTTKEEIKQIIVELSELLQQFCGGEIKTFILNSSTPEVEI